MTIDLYKTVSQHNKINKTLTDMLEFSDVKIKGSCSIESPKLIITGLTDFSYNYVYIPQYSRYYYIKDITVMTNDIVQLDCSVDVLMSFKDQILTNKGTVERNEDIYNSMFVDSSIPTTIDNNVRTVKFPIQPFNGVSYIINYIG